MPYVNGELFALHVEQVLAPPLVKGDVVILANLGSHKGKAARRAIRSVSAHMLFLPPYGSPDRAALRQAQALDTRCTGQNRRSNWQKLGDLLLIVLQEECAKYLSNAGYTAGQLKHAPANERPTMQSAVNARCRTPTAGNIAKTNKKSRPFGAAANVTENRDGAARGIRTPDPLITNEVLYQLSYCGDGWGCISTTPF